LVVANPGQKFPLAIAKTHGWTDLNFNLGGIRGEADPGLLAVHTEALLLDTKVIQGEVDLLHSSVKTSLLNTEGIQGGAVLDHLTIHIGAPTIRV
jgi:hypothetical protein